MPGPGSHPRGRGHGPGPGRRRECARRGWRSPQHRAQRSLGLRAERSSALGSGLLPQGQATLGRQRQNKTQAPQSRQRMLAAAPGPAGCSRASQRWSAPGRPSRTFSVHRRVGGRCSERAGTACIPFSNPLSRGSLRAASCALLRTPLSFLHVCWSLWG